MSQASCEFAFNFVFQRIGNTSMMRLHTIASIGILISIMRIDAGFASSRGPKLLYTLRHCIQYFLATFFSKDKIHSSEMQFYEQTASSYFLNIECSSNER